MKLTQLLNSVIVNEIVGNADIEIESLTHKSSEITKNSLFFCIEGTHTDSHVLAPEVVKKGAVALVVNRKLDIDVTQIVVKNTRSAMAIISQNFYHNAIKAMKLVAVVGTNGKTSTCFILKEILKAAGKSVGLIGTNGIIIEDEYFDCDLTTPDPIDLNRAFLEMKEKGVEYVVMEASAHAIALNKLDGIQADVGIFTNVGHDHMDFFLNMEDYAKTKFSFFTKELCRVGVVNADDDYGKELIKSIKIPTVTYGIKSPCDVFAINFRSSSSGSEYYVNLFDEIVDIKYHLSGLFNLYNTLAAATAARILGINKGKIAEGIARIKRIEGRNERLHGDGFDIVVDFAHTPDGFINILRHLKSTTKNNLITVFGCGGERDRQKRGMMGHAASLYSDKLILTEDNSRSEDRLDIISDIISGVSKPYKIVPDRKEAIIYALKEVREGDTVAVLGKGAEKEIIRGNQTIPHNDIDFITYIITEGIIKDTM